MFVSFIDIQYNLHSFKVYEISLLVQRILSLFNVIKVFYSVFKIAYLIFLKHFILIFFRSNEVVFGSQYLGQHN